jgi:hypothetical protein
MHSRRRFAADRSIDARLLDAAGRATCKDYHRAFRMPAALSTCNP